jgi:predicted metal-dependent phosphoesterase TrpH
MRYDLHIHSEFSVDGTMSLKEIVELARKRGLGGIAITDHNTIKGGMEAKQYETDDFEIIIGSEVMTERGEVTGLFLSREVVARDFRSAVADIKSQGGIVVIPHPFDRLRKSAFHPRAEDSEWIDAIEVFNARCVFSGDNDRAAVFAAAHNLAIVAGSDAHYRNEVGIAGVITKAGNLQESILTRSLEIFGKRTFLGNHLRTKLRKIWGKAAQSG